MIIPFFIMNRGCPHRCLFCNEQLTAGERPDRVTEPAFTETVRQYLAAAGHKRRPIQIAFYGGTFTGMDRREQRRLLEMAMPFLSEGIIDSVRISTRPDEIDSERLAFLKTFGVSTVEIGTQSLDDEVLLHSRRGHTAADTVRAVTLLREGQFATGIHLMTGLPGESPESFAQTVEKVIGLRPDMVRIHPTIVLKDTPLAEAVRDGRYLPLMLGEAITRCAQALRKLTIAGIPVIRLGLQATRELEAPGAVVAGPYHPAFRSLVESLIYQEMATALLTAAGSGRTAVTFALAPADISSFVGLKRGGIAVLQERFNLTAIRIAAAPSLPRHTLVLALGDGALTTDLSGIVRPLAAEELHAILQHAMVRANR